MPNPRRSGLKGRAIEGPPKKGQKEERGKGQKESCPQEEKRIKKKNPRITRGKIIGKHKKIRLMVRPKWARLWGPAQ
jgi:hypothetical protein